MPYPGLSPSPSLHDTFYHLETPPSFQTSIAFSDAQMGKTSLNNPPLPVLKISRKVREILDMK